MQEQLGTDDVVIVGINEAGFETANDLMTNGRDLPWLQDTAEDDVWNTWVHEYRDVRMLDRQGVEVSVYNLTDNDLADPANFGALKSTLEDLIAE